MVSYCAQQVSALVGGERGGGEVRAWHPPDGEVMRRKNTPLRAGPSRELIVDPHGDEGFYSSLARHGNVERP